MKGEKSHDEIIIADDKIFEEHAPAKNKMKISLRGTTSRSHKKNKSAWSALDSAWKEEENNEIVVGTSDVLDKELKKEGKKNHEMIVPTRGTSSMNMMISEDHKELYSERKEMDKFLQNVLRFFFENIPQLIGETGKKFWTAGFSTMYEMAVAGAGDGASRAMSIMREQSVPARRTLPVPNDQVQELHAPSRIATDGVFVIDPKYAIVPVLKWDQICMPFEVEDVGKNTGDVSSAVRPCASRVGSVSYGRLESNRSQRALIPECADRKYKDKFSQSRSAYCEDMDVWRSHCCQMNRKSGECYDPTKLETLFTIPEMVAADFCHPYVDPTLMHKQSKWADSIYFAEDNYFYKNLLSLIHI